MFSAFNPSKCTHTWSSGQPTLRRPGSSWGFGALPKGFTSVMDTSCQSRDSNPQPWVTSGFKSKALSIRPRLPHSLSYVIFNTKMTLFEMCLLWSRVRGKVRSNNVTFALKMT